jgi:Asp-tRNA(Asn)/Glu-tRNA(Gln) amidotransferase A subunit family amidase
MRLACLISLCLTSLVLLLLAAPAAQNQAAFCSDGEQPQSDIDRDLLETNIPALHRLYVTRKYTVTQVVRWYLTRIAKYNGIYKAVETLHERDALEQASVLDAQARAAGPNFKRSALWGVPIVIKANTSIKGKITTDGWRGYKIRGHELIAPADATVVKKLKAAGAVILGQTNMPDFAASDTNRSTSFGRTGNAYDVRFSPGGSSGGTVTAVTADLAILGTGSDTGNSIRMPAATSGVVGLFPTPGLVSTAGIAPLDWLLDNTGPIARNVTDVAIALNVMAGEDPLDARTAGSAAKLQPLPYVQYLKADALKGKRLGVPAFVMQGAGVPFQGISSSLTGKEAQKRRRKDEIPLRPETRDAFMRAIDGLRQAGATIVFDKALLPDSFADAISRVYTRPYVRQGTENFMRHFGPSQYRSIAEYERVVGSPIPAVITGAAGTGVDQQRQDAVKQAILESDPQADANYFGPRQRAMRAYKEAFDRFKLDGLVYPATQMPPPDETMPQDGQLSSGPHSNTGWVNMIGVPAIVVPAGLHANGLPFGLEMSARPWQDGDLLGYAYAYEQAAKPRRPPVLVERGLLPARN